MRGQHARRTGPVRAVARNRRYLADTTRQVTEARPTTREGREEALVEDKRKGYIRALSTDQRITRNKQAVDRYYRAYTTLITAHLLKVHGVEAGEDAGKPWRLDARHEQAHGR
jgi:hypothetical protein